VAANKEALFLGEWASGKGSTLLTEFSNGSKTIQ
jgi:hypothetical protein